MQRRASGRGAPQRAALCGAASAPCPPTRAVQSDGNGGMPPAAPPRNRPMTLGEEVCHDQFTGSPVSLYVLNVSPVCKRIPCIRLASSAARRGAWLLAAAEVRTRAAHRNRSPAAAHTCARALFSDGPRQRCARVRTLQVCVRRALRSLTPHAASVPCAPRPHALHRPRRNATPAQECNARAGMRRWWGTGAQRVCAPKRDGAFGPFVRARPSHPGSTVRGCVTNMLSMPS